MDCFVASAPRNDDTPIASMTSHSRGTMRPRFSGNLRPLKSEGAGKTGCALHPRSRVQACTKKRTRAYRFSGEHPAFPAQWFTAYSALSPATGFVATVIPEKFSSHELDASIGASGPHDFAVRISAVRRRHIRVHRIPPHVS